MRYVIGRVQRLVIVLVIVTFTTFLLVNVLPGDVAYQLGGMDASQEEIEQIRRSLGLDQPMLARYLGWMADLLRGDWGHSLLTGESVWEMITQRFPISLQLMLMAQFMALALAVPAGLATAWRAGGWLDRLVTSIGFAMVSMPTFLIAILLIYLFSLHLGWLPATGYEPISEGLWANLRPMILPAASLALVKWTVLMRTLRAEMIGTLQENHISLARAKGMSNLRILFAHALRPSSFSTVTILGLQVARLMSGAIILEQIFGIPGLGRMLIHAVYTRDFIVIQGCVTFFALTYVLMNFVVDLAYAWLDPRVRERRAHG